MTVSLYDVSVPIFIKMLTSLSHVMAKGEEHLKDANLAEARLAPDMLPFPFQIQAAADTAKNSVKRLNSAVDVPTFENTEATFADLQARLQKTIELLKSVKKEDIDGREDAEVVMSLGPGKEIKFKGLEYLQTFALPNFFFHVVTAYDILRSRGVQIGKMDYIKGGAA